MRNVQQLIYLQKFTDRSIIILDTALVLFISVCLKPAALEYGDLIYANRKSLATTLKLFKQNLGRHLSNHSSVTLPHFIGQRNTAFQTSECTIHQTANFASGGGV